MSFTTGQKLDQLISYSDKVYRAIDTEVNGESRARSIIRLGIAVAARELESGFGDGLVAGDYVHSLIWSELKKGGVVNADTKNWSRYEITVDNLPRPPLPVITDAELDEIAEQYADVKRITLSRDGSLETDARHAVHMTALALCYAAEYYPYLDQSRIAMYGILHDILEFYAGDVNTLEASKEQMKDKEETERAGLRLLDSKFSDRYPRLMQAIHDYENLADDEARYVKTFDKVDPGFTHLYSKGAVLTGTVGIQTKDQFLEFVDQSNKQIRLYSGDFLSIIELRHELTRRVAAVTDWPEQKEK